MSSTIAAIASAGGAGRRAVLRVSGPRAAGVGKACCRAPGEDPLILAERGAQEVRFHDGVGWLPCLAVWMPGPRSFTAEDVLELHLPGHVDLAQGALERVLAAGAVLAEPGEFTRRAFENGRIDLTRAEGVLALVHARTTGERRAASALLAGGLDHRLGELRASLEAVRALTEASLDFDEADTGHVPTVALREMASEVLAGVSEALGWERARVASAGTRRVVIAGEPNAGKSTLFNRLAAGLAVEASGAALVSDFAGTTRDAKRAEWRLGPGGRCELLDTAGVAGSAAETREADDPDRIAEERASRLVGTADLVLAVVDAAAPALPPLDSEGAPVLLAWNKTDLEGAASEPVAALLERVDGWVGVSASRGTGLDELGRCALALMEPHGGGSARDGAVGLGARHLRSLEGARAGVERALAGLAGGGGALDLVAQDLREATDALDGITGRTTPEDLLDRIFAQFCLGK
ncbi:MAG: 50S ribosome-binding GTPase [Planctomycetota bacterium]|nr:50S ribosome-binding GTPase [Planctomycetota bacterium]